MKPGRIAVSLLFTLMLLTGLLLSRTAQAQVSCSDSHACANGQIMKCCAETCGEGCLHLWYQIGDAVFPCNGGGNCSDTSMITAAAMQATEYCSGGDPNYCAAPCGEGCCDGAAGGCCNGGCLDEGQTCCGEGLCEAGTRCSNGACIPETATDCGDGTYCSSGACCNGGCLYAWETCCGAGICGAGETCATGLCVPTNGVPCGDGTLCPAGTACAGGQCCPAGFASYDAASGYCCGAGPEAGICACPVACNGVCCPENTVCCDGGFCAPSAEGCPVCPANAPMFCPDHTCAFTGATCCGNGFYCNNQLTCMDCGNGVTCCGNQSNQAQPVVIPQTYGTGQPATVLKPVQAATAGKAPGTPKIASAAGAVPGKVLPARTSSGDSSGCSLSSRRASASPLAPLALLTLILITFSVRRFRRPARLRS